MSDSEVPPGSRGGPAWMRNGPSPRSPSPAAVSSAAPTHFDDAGPEPSVHIRYARHGVTPVPYLVAAVVAMAAAWWAVDWSKPVLGAPDPVRTSEWWTNITSVLLPGEDIRLGSYSQFRMAVALVLLVLAAIAVALWIGRIGTNVRPGHGPFGSVLPLLAFPAWWLLPLTIGTTADGGRSRSDLLVRFLVAFAILFAQFLLLRWPTLNRMWRAGHLPYDMASVLLWLPMMIPWLLLFASNIYTLMVIGNDGNVAESGWQPTMTMVDWARGTSRAVAVATFVLLVVVTVAQHIGMAEDKAAEGALRPGPQGGLDQAGS